MDLFKFSGNEITDFDNGVPILNYTSAMWVERYKEPGEFEIKAKLSSGLQFLLPLGSIISHTKTYEACIVENIEINETASEDPIIIISGRSLDSYLENRIVGLNIVLTSNNVPFAPYVIPADKLDTQIYALIVDHIFLGPDIIVHADGTSNIEVERNIKRQDVLSVVNELLTLDDYGLRIVRKNQSGAIISASESNTVFYIHKGVDHSNDVIFSWNLGELESANYLFSIKSLKTAALVQSTYVETVVYDTSFEHPYDYRFMFVDASDIDKSFTEIPNSTEIAQIIEQLEIRGAEALASQTLVDISSVDVSKATNYKYRRDYDIGDIVSISGNYGVTEKRRVIEFVEIEDENGEVGYPTLSKI